MLVRSVSFGLTAETPATSGAGVVLAQPGPPTVEGGALVHVVHGSSRVPAVDIEVERAEVLRGVFLTLIYAPAQGGVTVPLLGPRVVFPDDIDDVGADLVGSFRCEIVLAPRVGAFYLHAAYRQYVSNVVRLMAPPGAR